MSVKLKQQYGQFFTVDKSVQEAMTNLLTPREVWNVLEPSVGAGHLAIATLSKYHDAHIDAWEIDTTLQHLPQCPTVTYGDFFTLSVGKNSSYHSIIGNPPYLAWKNVVDSTRIAARETKQRYSDKVNLYQLFLDKCIDLLLPGGEMVMIVPKEWMFSTSSEPLRLRLATEGKLTHLIDVGETKVFPDADVPAIVIFRWEKSESETNQEMMIELFVNDGNIIHPIDFKSSFDEINWERRVLKCGSGADWLIVDPDLSNTIESWNGSLLKDVLRVRVGNVTGLDSVFNVTKSPLLSSLLQEGSTREYVTTKGLEYYIDVNHCLSFEEVPPVAAQLMMDNKEALFGRKICKITESNWWKYGAIRNVGFMGDGWIPGTIYSWAKTRQTKPFFLSDGRYWGGGILALTPNKEMTVEETQLVLSFLNSSDFRKVCIAGGITTNNKLVLQPSTLERMPFPTLEWLKSNTFS